jgi:hypothetical protein
LTKLDPQVRSTSNPRHIRNRKKPPNPSPRQLSAKKSQHTKPTTKHDRMGQYRPWDPYDTCDPSSYSDSDSDDYCIVDVYLTHQANLNPRGLAQEETPPIPHRRWHQTIQTTISEAPSPDGTRSTMAAKSTTIPKQPPRIKILQNVPKHS